MRRVAGAILLATFAVTAPPGRTSAHPVATVSVIPVGRPATVNISVPSESAMPMVGVDIHVPEGFRLEQVVEPQGWTASRDASTVRFRTAGVAHGGFASFALRGVAERKAVLRFPVTTHAADGATEQWGGAVNGLSQGATVYAGYSAVPGSDGGGQGIDWMLVGGVAMVAAAVVGVVVPEVRRRRRSSEDRATDPAHQ